MPDHWASDIGKRNFGKHTVLRTQKMQRVEKRINIKKGMKGRDRLERMT